MIHDHLSYTPISTTLTDVTDRSRRLRRITLLRNTEELCIRSDQRTALRRAHRESGRGGGGFPRPEDHCTEDR